MKLSTTKLYLQVLALLCCSRYGQAADMEITSFHTSSQRPLTQIFGLPAESSAEVIPSGRLKVTFSQDIASEYTASRSSSEQITLDGESYRWTLGVRYGIGGHVEAGVDIPYILYSGGFMDGAIVDWHSAFGMPQGGRDNAPRNQLNFRYSKNGIDKLKMDHESSGTGDISFQAGAKVYEMRDAATHDNLALRTSIKIPTGSSIYLRGSGSTDFTLSLCGSMNKFTEWGSLGVFASLGGMVMTRGRVLADQQNRQAGFGTIGLGWGPSEWVSIKLQLNANTPMYHGSALDELSKNTMMLVGGGTIKLPAGYMLDIGVSEDIAVATAPDVAFNLGLSKQF